MAKHFATEAMYYLGLHCEQRANMIRAGYNIKPLGPGINILTETGSGTISYQSQLPRGIPIDI